MIFSLSDPQDRVLRHYRGRTYAAHVTLEIEPIIGPSIVTVRCTGNPSFRQGAIVEVPADGWADWKAGAITGAKYALECAGQHDQHIIITRIIGTFTDTNPSIIAVAAAYAVWRTVVYTPNADDAKILEAVAVSSWEQPEGHVPILPAVGEQHA